ncbi:MAG TPA: serine hydrolase domain-containing protein [Sphingomicrobium sp.]
MSKSAVAFVAAMLLATTAESQPANSSLDGLWVAKERYGPDVRGTLMILPRGEGWVADIAGFTVPVEQRGQKLSFVLPDGNGTFVGIRSGSAISGHWVQRVIAENGIAFSTPVVLRRDNRGRWRGEVAPLEEQMTYYLPLEREADGRYSTYLRNPERNRGLFIGATRLDTQGETVTPVGTPRGQAGERVIGTGRRDPESSLLSIAMLGGALNFTRDNDLSSPFYPRGNPAARYRYSPPVQLDDGWPVSTLAKEGIDQAAIEAFVQRLIDLPQDGVSSSQVHSLIIVRHGKLVLEEYFHGFGRDTPHDTRSASKSWTNVLIGAAMQSGVPIRLDTPVYRTLLGQVPADLDPRKRSMTLEHLISMTAGFDCNDSGERPGDEDVMQQQTRETDWHRYSLGVPMAWNNGDKIVYCSMKPNLAAGMLERISGEPLPEMFDRLVARPMHMRNYHLFLQPNGEAYGGGGHRFTTRDFLKLAQLMVDDGRWEGRQIVSREWARRSVAPLRLLSPKAGQTYGYLWNSVEYPYKGRKVYAFFAAGNGGQIYMGIPALDLVIGFTGGNYADNDVLRIPQRKFVPEDILPAVR